MTNHGTIDADSLVYAAGFAAQRTKHILCTPEGGIVAQYDKKSEAMHHKHDDPILEYDTYVEAATLFHATCILDGLITSICDGASLKQFRTYLTGGKQWRVPYSTIQKYKGNRDNFVKPVHYHDLRKHLTNQWDAYVIEYIEADDACIMDAYANPGTVICSIDKDLRQFAGWHYNPNKIENGVFEVTEWEAALNFYSQLLTGDKIDNIKGLSRKKPRRGIGEATAKKLLTECHTERELFDVCLNQYAKRYGEEHTYECWQGKEHTRNAMEMLDENAQLLYLARFDGDKWSVPR